MGYYFTDDEDELQHHGILGQKWGVRRFQNKDGTRTPAGKKRYDDDETDDSSNSNTGGSSRSGGGFKVDKQTVMTAAGITAAVALGAVLVTNPGARNIVAKYGKTAMTSLGTAAGKGAATFMNNAPGVAKKIGSGITKSVSEAGDAAFKAALTSVSAIAVAKVTDKLSVGDDATEAEKNRSKVMTDAATAAINSIANSSKSNSKSGGKNGVTVGKEISDKVGEPTKKGIDKSSKEYNALFKDDKGNERDKETKDTIRAMAKAGYDIDQIDKYLNHAEFEDWASQYMAVGIGW